MAGIAGLRVRFVSAFPEQRHGGFVWPSTMDNSTSESSIGALLRNRVRFLKLSS